jgi:hypothetical protein
MQDHISYNNQECQKEIHLKYKNCIIRLLASIKSVVMRDYFLLMLTSYYNCFYSTTVLL